MRFHRKKSLFLVPRQQKWERIGEEPKVEVVGERGGNAREQTYTTEQYLAMEVAAAEHLKPIFKVAIHTGMRKGGLVGLRWEYIDWKSEMIRLPADTVKEKRAKRIPMSPYVKETLGPQIRQQHRVRIYLQGKTHYKQFPTVHGQGSCERRARS